MNPSAPHSLSGKLLVILLFFFSGISAQPSIQDSLDLITFLDGLMEAHLENEHIAGAAVSVVQDGRLLFAKGYGYADLDARQSVDPLRTLFRVGSISKLFVWTAVMQLVEQGKLDLDADINTYLKDVRVPDAFGQAVTMKHLMTHTAGFEDRVIGLFAKSEDALRPLGRILKEEMPARVHPPGTLASYSNHGTGLAAYIVEQIAGLAFNDYVERHLFTPLKMDRATFRQPLPEMLAGYMSKGYAYRNAGFQEEDFEFVPLYPVGSMSATATDMAKFMLAHLQLGTYDSTAVLDTATAMLMQSEAFRHAPGLNPSLYGFYSMDRNGQRIFGHGGDTFWFHSLLALIPEYKTGLFVSFNSQTGGGVAQKVLKAITDRYFPVDPTTLEAPVDDRSSPENFAGAYRSIRYPHKRLSKMIALSGALNVEASSDGLLKTTFGKESARWVQTGPLAFREEHGTGTLAFRENAQGKVTYLFLGELPIMAFEKTPPLERPEMVAGMLGTAVAVFLLTLTGWATGFRLRRKYHVRHKDLNLLPQSARWVGWLAALCFLLYFTGMAAVIIDDPEALAFSVPEPLKILSGFPIAGAAFTVVAFIFMLAIWGRRQGRTGARIWYTLLTLACLASLLQLWHWNLLGFNFG